MKKSVRCSPPQRQQGIAMVVALLLLVVITVMGLVSLRSGMMSGKITASARASIITFQAAESALNAVFREAVDASAADPANIVNVLVSQLALGTLSPVDRCVTHTDSFIRRPCIPGDTFDSRGLIQASSRVAIRPDPKQVRPRGNNQGGTQISRTGAGATLFADYEFVAVGRGALDALTMETYTVQEFAKIGVVPGDDL